MTYTPGPWRATHYSNGYPVCVIEHEDPDETWYVVVDGPTRQEPEGDARLIAAAPELLEACEIMIDAHNAPDHRLFNEQMDEAWDLARAAIAKAKGETE